MASGDASTHHPVLCYATLILLTSERPRSKLVRPMELPERVSE